VRLETVISGAQLRDVRKIPPFKAKGIMGVPITATAAALHIRMQ
jgi:hypothetical protein